MKTIKRIMTTLIIVLLLAVTGIVACTENENKNFDLTDFPAPAAVTAGYQTAYAIPAVVAKGNDGKDYKAEPSVTYDGKAVEVFGNSFIVEHRTDGYVITYTVEAYGKKFEKQTAVTVVDATAPVLVVSDYKKIYDVGDELELPNATATDEIDGEVAWKAAVRRKNDIAWTDVEDGYKLQNEGKHELKIYAADNSGNTAEVILDFVVRAAKEYGEVELFKDEYASISMNTGTFGLTTNPVGQVDPDGYYAWVQTQNSKDSDGNDAMTWNYVYVNPRTSKEEVAELIEEDGLDSFAIRVYIEYVSDENKELYPTLSNLRLQWDVLTDASGNKRYDYGVARDLPTGQWITVVYRESTLQGYKGRELTKDDEGNTVVVEEGEYIDYTGKNFLQKYVDGTDVYGDKGMFAEIVTQHQVKVYFDGARFAKYADLELSLDSDVTLAKGGKISKDDFTVNNVPAGSNVTLTISHNGITKVLTDEDYTLEDLGVYTVRAELDGKYVSDASTQFKVRTEREEGELEAFNDPYGDLQADVWDDSPSKIEFVQDEVGGVAPANDGYFAKITAQSNRTNKGYDKGTAHNQFYNRVFFTPRYTNAEIKALAAAGTYNAIEVRMYVTYIEGINNAHEPPNTFRTVWGNGSSDYKPEGLDNIYPTDTWVTLTFSSGDILNNLHDGLWTGEKYFFMIINSPDGEGADKQPTYPAYVYLDYIRLVKTAGVSVAAEKEFYAGYEYKAGDVSVTVTAGGNDVTAEVDYDLFVSYRGTGETDFYSHKTEKLVPGYKFKLGRYYVFAMLNNGYSEGDYTALAGLGVSEQFLIRSEREAGELEAFNDEYGNVHAKHYDNKLTTELVQDEVGGETPANDGYYAKVTLQTNNKNEPYDNGTKFDQFYNHIYFTPRYTKAEIAALAAAGTYNAIEVRLYLTYIEGINNAHEPPNTFRTTWLNNVPSGNKPDGNIDNIYPADQWITLTCSSIDLTDLNDGLWTDSAWVLAVINSPDYNSATYPAYVYIDYVRLVKTADVTLSFDKDTFYAGYEYKAGDVSVTVKDGATDVTAEVDYDLFVSYRGTGETDFYSHKTEKLVSGYTFKSGNYYVYAMLNNAYSEGDYTALAGLGMSEKFLIRSEREAGELEAFNDEYSNVHAKHYDNKLTAELVRDEVGGETPANDGYYAKVTLQTNNRNEPYDNGTKFDQYYNYVFFTPRYTKAEIAALAAAGTYNAIEVRLYLTYIEGINNSHEPPSTFRTTWFNYTYGDYKPDGNIDNIYPADQWITLTCSSGDILNNLKDGLWTDSAGVFGVANSPDYNSPTYPAYVYIDYVRLVKTADVTLSNIKAFKAGDTYSDGDVTVTVKDGETDVTANVDYDLFVSFRGIGTSDFYNQKTERLVPGYTFRGGDHIIFAVLNNKYGKAGTDYAGYAGMGYSSTVRIHADSTAGEIEFFNDPYSDFTFKEGNTVLPKQGFTCDAVGGELPKGGKGFYGYITTKDTNSTLWLYLNLTSRTTKADVAAANANGVTYNALEMRIYIEYVNAEHKGETFNNIRPEWDGTNNCVDGKNLETGKWITVTFKDRDWADIFVNGENAWGSKTYLLDVVSTHYAVIYFDYIKFVKA